MSSIVIDITSKCNLRCKHCYNADKYFNNTVEDMSTEQIKKLTSLLLKEGYDEINILGGEPFTRKDIFELLRHFTLNNYRILLTTNGTLLNKDICEKLLNYNIDTIYISMDGANTEVNDLIRGRGTFETVVKNIFYLQDIAFRRESSIKIALSCVVTEKNINSLNEVVLLCKELKIHNLIFTPLIKSGNAIKSWKLIEVDKFELLNAIESSVSYAEKYYPGLCLQIDARPCVAMYFSAVYSIEINYSLSYSGCDVLNNKMLYITANGNVHPCGLYAMESGQLIQKEGYFDSSKCVDINSIQNVNDIENGIYFKKFKQNLDMLHKKKYSKHCSDCLVKNDCYPCSFQFKDNEEIDECSWAFSRSNLLKTIAKNKIVDFALKEKATYLEEKKSREILERLTINKSIVENYNNFNVYNEFITLLEYMVLINQLKRKYLIGVKNEN